MAKGVRMHVRARLGPERDTDQFEITLPEGYRVDELPPPVDADHNFVAYHSKTQLIGQTLRYTRTFEINSVSVPAAQADELKQLYRTIHNDERMAAVLKRVSP